MKELTPQQVQNYLASHQALLLDVREPWEWEKCHLDGARLLPMGQILSHIDSLDKTQPVVVVCHHGIRSRQVARYLDSIGFEMVINLLGGVDAWAKELDPSMAQY